MQRQLEYLTAVQHGLVAKTGTKYRARSGFQAAAEVWKNHGGPRGFYLGFPLHICRDTLGTGESILLSVKFREAEADSTLARSAVLWLLRYTTITRAATWLAGGWQRRKGITSTLWLARSNGCLLVWLHSWNCIMAAR